MAPNDEDEGTRRLGSQHTSALDIAIKNFSPIWFSISMDTGIISIIMNLLPWQFNGLGILATIMFVWNLVLFSIFTLISIARLFRHGRHVQSELYDSTEQMSYQAAPAIAYLTLVAQVSLTCSTAWGHRFTILAYVLWWIGLVWTVTLCSWSVLFLSKYHFTENKRLPPAIFFPLIGVITQGTVGGLVVNYSAGLSATLAIPIIIVSFMLIGYSFFLSIMYYTIYFHQLLTVGPPQKATIPSMVVTIGPLGQFATSIQLLGTAASSKRLFADYNQGTFLTASAAESLTTICVVLALMAMGFGFLWITVAWYHVVESLVKRQLPFSLTWWSLIFPIGVYTTALLNLSKAMDSSGFRGLTAALLVFLLIVYFVNLFMTAYRIFTGHALGVPQEREQEKEEERNRRHQRSVENSSNA
ncbi:hypothetical protein P280DRAFT_173589 [Massarina eburnea CBS 473.64]|uniref:C4-dicarboxylate transporter/malic acid transport protein n=1 Tax=Massarina eburnea CBS 473.64 TaxID=1395130 RepID=A0A6A6S9H6_9PLEO|nr:hypothetical protein P280DRAFT_173589 [Massarina eburnea CBS 473.64]